MKKKTEQHNTKTLYYIHYFIITNIITMIYKLSLYNSFFKRNQFRATSLTLVRLFPTCSALSGRFLLLVLMSTKRATCWLAANSKNPLLALGSFPFPHHWGLSDNSLILPASLFGMQGAASSAACLLILSAPDCWLLNLLFKFSCSQQKGAVSPIWQGSADSYLVFKGT